MCIPLEKDHLRPSTSRSIAGQCRVLQASARFITDCATISKRLTTNTTSAGRLPSVTPLSKLLKPRTSMVSLTSSTTSVKEIMLHLCVSLSARAISAAINTRLRCTRINSNLVCHRESRSTPKTCSTLKVDLLRRSRMPRHSTRKLMELLQQELSASVTTSGP